MSKLLPIVTAITGTTIIGSVGSYLLLTQKAISIKEKFKGAIIDFTKDTSLITTKLNKLKNGKINSNVQKLKDAQTKAKINVENGKEDFKIACEEIYKSNFDKKESALFKDFKEYCSWNVKDKMGDKWFNSRVAWNTRFEKLNKPTNKASSSSLKKVTNDTELKKWCEDIAIELFEGDGSLEFKDTKEYCKKEG